MHYQNKQMGTALLLVMGAVILFISLLAFDKSNEVIWPVIIFIGLISFLFHSLNITVDEYEINWSFGPGFWKKSVKLEAVNSVNVIKTKWYYGLGIRYIPSGWLYTVSGTTAIQLELKGGSKINLGTNDPDNLVEAIKSQLRS
jgi:hypothetical protein|tara:strand:+ start:1940 stop:2368 length:429 start_codon:yes stop_codon:yes gene_type:complete